MIIKIPKGSKCFGINFDCQFQVFHNCGSSAYYKCGLFNKHKWDEEKVDECWREFWTGGEFEFTQKET